MVLEMRKICEACQSHLEDGEKAFICSHECTFCAQCTEELKLVCPNCSGELVRRPERADAS
ncbi:MAG: DUF1272 domain-containing protein [Acidobacteriota bacterium]|nr:DUF1272 domain-containing protein [Acidobacteriota bacterium]MDH3530121.1 DUF1272 domain-containing protein [Acidobacteriota bacterium]